MRATFQQRKTSPRSVAPPPKPNKKAHCRERARKAMLPTPAQMNEFERQAFAGGCDADAAMDEAGAALASWVRSRHPMPGTLFLFLGRGHNAGDALVAASHLAAAGWHVHHHFACGSALAPRTADRLAALGQASTPFDPAAIPTTSPRPWVSLDGLVGIGARLPLSPDLAHAVELINTLRRNHAAHTIAVDVPSGLDAATGLPGTPTVSADSTATMAVAKSGLVADSAIPFVGRLAVLRLASLPWHENEAPSTLVADSTLLAPFLPQRPHTLHKGSAGRIALIAGSPAYSGAGALAATGALHAGAGLITLFAPKEALPLIIPRCPPEIIIRPIDDFQHSHASDFDAIGIGPGLGDTPLPFLGPLMRHAAIPLVLDADALNQIAAGHHGRALHSSNLPGARILTPHPGEFARLSGKKGGAEKNTADTPHTTRAEAARQFARAHPAATLLLKGPLSIVVADGHPLAYNPTGGNALATGGSGDVLTGITTALAARLPDKPWHAAALAAWLHGRAAENAQSHGNESAESLAPTTLARWLGSAFTDLRHRTP